MDWSNVVTTLILVFQFVTGVGTVPYTRTFYPQGQTDKILVEVQGPVPLSLKVNGVSQLCIYYNQYVCGTGVVAKPSVVYIESASNLPYTLTYKEYDEQMLLPLPMIMKKSNETNSGGLPFSVEPTPVE